MTIRSASIKGMALAAAAACVASFAAQAAAADLGVGIEGLRSAEGDVRVALHRQVPDGDFPGDAGVVAATIRSAAPGAVRVVFADLAPGDYAVAAFHDADGDGELATNFLGMPTEGYGFSNGAVGFMGPPGFEAAAVSVGTDDVRISVTIVYADTHGQVSER